MTTTSKKLNLIYFIKNYRKIAILEMTQYEKKKVPELTNCIF